MSASIQSNSQVSTKERIQEGIEQGKERLQDGIESTKEMVGLKSTPTSEFQAELKQMASGGLHHTEPPVVKSHLHDVALETPVPATGTEGFDVNHPVHDGVISNLTKQVQNAYISAKEMVGLQEKHTPSDKAGVAAFKSELKEKAVDVQGKELLNSEHSSGMLSNVTQQVQGAINSTAEWIKPTMVQGKETIQSGIESAKQTLGLKSSSTTEAPMAQENQNLDSKSYLVQGKEVIQSGIETAKVTLSSGLESAKATVGPALESAKATVGPALESAKATVGSGIVTAKETLGLKSSSQSTDKVMENFEKENTTLHIQDPHKAPGMMTNVSNTVQGTVNSTVAYIKPTVDSTVAYIKPTVDSTVAYIKPTVDSTVAYIKPTVDSTVAYIKPTVDSTVAYIKPTIDSTAEWAGLKAKGEPLDTSKIMAQGKEGVYSGIDKAKDMMGLKPTGTVTTKDTVPQKMSPEMQATIDHGAITGATEQL